MLSLRAGASLPRTNAMGPIAQKPRTTSHRVCASVGESPSAPMAGPPPLQKIKGILFDIDGTLANSDPLHFETFVEILQERGFNDGKPIDEEFFSTMISGRHNPEIAADLFPELSVDDQTAFYMEKEQRFRDKAAAGGLHPMPGLLDFIQWVDAQGLRKAAVTNAPRENTFQMLEAIGLGAYFETVVLGVECTRAKPHPDPYQDAMEFLGLAPEECLVIEDSPSGIEAGVAAGCYVVCINSGHARETVERAGASYFINDYNDLLALVTESVQA